MELIRINEVEGKQAVNARELYEFLDVQSKFADWFRNRVEKYDFQETKDFVSISKNLENGGRTIEYFITIEMAKELSMVENNEKGKIARKYFIECEKQLKKVFEIPQTYSQALLLAGKLAEENEKQAKYIEESRPKIEFFEAVAESKTAIDMRKASAVLDIKGFGRNNLLEFLRQKGILDGGNIPYRKYQDQGYFRVIETKWTDKYGETKISFKTVVYQKGLDFIRKMTLKES
jgi:anti-repressor protein